MDYFRDLADCALSVTSLAAAGLAGEKRGQLVMGNTMRFFLAVALIAGTGLLLQARGRNEVFPPRQPLKSFPKQFGPWTSTEVPIEKDVLEILGPGDFLLREYTAPGNVTPLIDLFIAYFPSQRAGDTIHSPQHCLPGAGWLPVESSRTTLSIPEHG